MARFTFEKDPLLGGKWMVVGLEEARIDLTNVSLHL